MTPDIYSLNRANRLTKKRIELRRLKEANGIMFYSPHHKQGMFHEAGAFKYRYVRTGNRFGKSHMGAAEDVAWALGYRPWYPEGHPARYGGIPQRPVKLLIITIDWDKAREVFTDESSGISRGKIFQFMPSSAIVHKHRNSSGAIDVLTVKSRWGGESTIHFDTVQSYKTNPMGVESSVWDGIHVDEPCPQPMFKGAARGLVDTGGKAWFTCTPKTEMWINRFFLPTARFDIGDGDIPYTNDADKKWMICGTMRDNPHNDEESIADFEKTLTDDERECFINGIPIALSGVIYKEFDPSKHVYHNTPHGWAAANVPPGNYTLRYAIDCHPKTAQAVLFSATSPHGKTFFFQEIFVKCLIPELCDRIKSVLRHIDEENKKFHKDEKDAAGIPLGRCPPVLDAIVDPIAYIEDAVTGRACIDEFIRNGIYLDKAIKDPSYGILKVRQSLAAPDTFYFQAGLTETLYEFDNYVWNPNLDKPVKVDDHMMEDLYRLTLLDLNYIAPHVGKTHIVKPITIDPSPDFRAHLPTQKKKRRPVRYSRAVR